MQWVDMLDTGVGQGHVEATPFFHDGGHALVNRLLIRNVHGQGHGGAPCLFNGINGVLGAFQGEVGHGHPGALTAIMFGYGPANSAPRPCDQGYPVF